ncbi:hypothetical protein G7Y89_g7419 [Cudoniella acicularis]|uniref:AIG1-type G domain-containing protein n=1 Tax=Cudoniella acicularis TaxID=354080 RepID=A0A8H4RIL5_9HELO|nr:hypothetical protein G7Y89_g7419 [Cudoniella acicularis]
MPLLGSRTDGDRFASMVLLMGNTGAGKSYFVNKLKEGSVVEGDSLYSCTARCQIIQATIGRTHIAICDCPGFNDTTRSDAEILNEISKILSSQYLLKKKLRLRGILYLRDITRKRMEGSDVRAFELFKKLVGVDSFPHVVFVTTMWGGLNEQEMARALKNEMELRDDFWQEMIQNGSYMTRFQGNKASAEGIVSQLIGEANPVILRIQRELVDNGCELADTAVGSSLLPVVEERLGHSKSKIKRLNERLTGESNATIQSKVKLDIKKAQSEENQAQFEKDQLKEKVGLEMKDKIKTGGTWQDNVRVICSVVGVSITIVASVILPAAGVGCNVM